MGRTAPRRTGVTGTTGTTSLRLRAGVVALAVAAAGLAISAPAHAAPAPFAGGVSVDVGGAGGSGFLADRFGTGGIEDSKPADAPSLPDFRATVANPIPAELWHTAVYTESSYALTGLTPGAGYELRLYFMDWYFVRAGQRVFDVNVNGAPVLEDFDIIGTAIERGADGRTAFGVERDLPVVADASGTVTVEFLRGAVNQPQINAIALVPQFAGGVSMDVGGAGGSGFVADRFGTGGIVDSKPADAPSLPDFRATVANPIPAELWHTAVYTESSYALTGLTPGAGYELRLYFMDWYFVRAGQRVFDVNVNGAPVLEDFDIIGTAIERGADGRTAFGVERDLPVVADASGTVTVDFLRGAVNQPQINAIALVPLAS